MINKWAVQADEFAVWYMNLEKVWDDPEVPLEWLLQVVSWAEELGIMKVIASPQLKYHRDSGQSIQDRIVQEYREAGVLNLGRFTEHIHWVGGSKSYPILETQLAWFDQAGSVVEGSVQRIGTHLADCRPDLKLNDFRSWIAPAIFMRGNPVPVSKLRRETDPYWHINNISVMFNTNTDIWQPFVYGKHDDWDSNQFHDNTPLARVHTPRLNEFLSRVRTLTLQVGGRWDGLDTDQSKGIHTMYRHGTIDLEWTPEEFWSKPVPMTDDELREAGIDIAWYRANRG